MTLEPWRWRCVCKVVSRNSKGIQYKSCNNVDYMSWNYHRFESARSQPKALWDVPPRTECETFCKAESAKWKDETGKLWGLQQDAAIELGKRGERMARFDPPTEEYGGIWHGYPVSGSTRVPKNSRRQPPDEIVEKWYTDKWISYTVRQRILKRKI